MHLNEYPLPFQLEFQKRQISVYTVPTNENGTVYQFSPLLTRRLMALRVNCFYLI
jgi:hypothetical protein